MTYGHRSLLPCPVGVLLVFSARAGWAHREDYLDETLVFVTLEQGELEPEYWVDYGHRADPPANFIRHHVTLEYGVTAHWMFDGRATIASTVGRATTFDSARLETRYRFGEEGELPVDIALSGEVNTERTEEGARDYGLEPRLILSKDVGALNGTLNLPTEISLRQGAVEFLPALGLRYDLSPLIRVGSECQGNPVRQEAVLNPQLWVVLPHEVTLKVGYAYGVGNTTEQFTRIALEVGF